jgi:NIPSNAP
MGTLGLRAGACAARGFPAPISDARWHPRPALKKGSHDKKLLGYFQADTGTINQLLHLWKFDDDADRRKHWAGVFANKDFVEGFASKFRPLVMTQEVKLLTAAPWGPHP